VTPSFRPDVPTVGVPVSGNRAAMSQSAVTALHISHLDLDAPRRTLDQRLRAPQAEAVRAAGDAALAHCGYVTARRVLPLDPRHWPGVCLTQAFVFVATTRSGK
jgi:hypothetical protein